MKNRLLIICLLTFTFGVHAQKLVGKVISVKDGDTIEMLLKDKSTVRIRLAAIDCPEKSQAFGARSKQFTSEKCFAKIVTAKQTDTDKYGRIIAFVYLANGECLNTELVKNGFAWHYKKYSKDATLSELEVLAREKKLGLWSDKEAVAPWNFRHSN